MTVDKMLTHILFSLIIDFTYIHIFLSIYNYTNNTFKKNTSN